MPVLLIRNDISKMDVDAIVNPANTKLLKGGGTSTAVFEAAGEEKLAAACRNIGSCKVGAAVMTDAFNLPAKHIIHAVGPVWQGGDAGEEKLLYSAYTSPLKLAVQKGLESIAFPLLSSGSYGYPKHEALKVAMNAINDFLLASEEDMMVYLVLYDRKSVAVSQEVFDSIDEYIDDNYVEEHPYRSLRSRSRMAEMYNTTEIPPLECCAAPSSLEDFLGKMEEDFSQMLLRLIDERGMTDAQAYKKANIDRKLFNKIKNNPGYTPTKKTIFAFAIALRLSRQETDELLMKAGYAFSNSSKFDLIVAYFIMNGMYDMFEINEVLFAYGQPLLGI